MPVLESPFELPSGRLLALDLGRVRHGVAVCDEMGILATPLAVVRRHRTRAEDFKELEGWVMREQVVGVIIGVPVQHPERVGVQERWVLRYGGRLAGALPVPVAFWDESLSTWDAAALIRRRDRSSLDAVAAAVLLRSFLEVRRSRSAVETT
jgi:putative Holliday junction resolvase